MIALLGFGAQAHVKDHQAHKLTNKKTDLGQYFVDKLLDRAVNLSPLQHADLSTTMLEKPSHLATSPRANLGLLAVSAHPRPASLQRTMTTARQTRRVAVAAEQKAFADNTGALLAISVGVAGAAIAGAAGLQESGVLPQDQAQAAVMLCMGGITTYGMVRGGPFFREDPWEHSAEMMARSDAGLMGPTSERPPLQATPPGNAAVTSLTDQGVVRLDGVLPTDKASAARSAVIKQLDAVLSEQEGQKEDRTKLGKVTCGKRRYDLLLHPSDGVLEAAMREALKGPLGELMKAKVGVDAPLFELAALVSDKGAGRQPVQVDTPYQAEPMMYTALVALQDEDVELGPTLFLPGTHTETAHEDFVGGDITRSDLLKRAPFFGSMLSTGDCAVFDSRVMHANAQNVKGKRAMLYFTFADPSTDLSKVGGFPASIAPNASSYRLADFLPTV